MWVTLGLSCLGFALLLESVGLSVFCYIGSFHPLFFKHFSGPFFLLFQLFDMNFRSLIMAPQISEACSLIFSLFFSCSDWVVSIFLYESYQVVSPISYSLLLGRSCCFLKIWLFYFSVLKISYGSLHLFCGIFSFISNVFAPLLKCFYDDCFNIF